mmetsp:Transcript_62896/g.154718  ORF Transcript_62896/g.154718 Transcript_62896/m.154718 type:complete len:256 (+) Transcript_62896:139-906(+)
MRPVSHSFKTAAGRAAHHGRHDKPDLERPPRRRHPRLGPAHAARDGARLPRHAGAPAALWRRGAPAHPARAHRRRVRPRAAAPADAGACGRADPLGTRPRGVQPDLGTVGAGDGGPGLAPPAPAVDAGLCAQAHGRVCRLHGGRRQRRARPHPARAGGDVGPVQPHHDGRDPARAVRHPGGRPGSADGRRDPAPQRGRLSRDVLADDAAGLAAAAGQGQEAAQPAQPVRFSAAAAGRPAAAGRRRPAVRVACVAR